MSSRPYLLPALLTSSLLVALAACTGDDPNVTPSSPDDTDGGSESGTTTPTGPCTETSCGAHGTCQGGTCACEAGYGGPTCATCAGGFQDNDKNGSCTAACAASSCAPHSACDDATGTLACACAVGYTGGGDAGSCVWTGGLLDPGFQGTPANAWTGDRGAVIDAAGAGSTEPGWAAYSQDASCRTGGRVTQVVAGMPAYAQAEPLAVNLTMRVKCTGVDCGGYEQGVGALLNGAYAGVRTSYPSENNTFVQKTLCLGERSFGGPLRVELHPLVAGCAGGTNDYDIHIDHAEIAPLATCPLLGQIPNAAFEAADGWTTSKFGTGVAAIVAAAGVGGTRGGQLDGTNASDRATITELVSVPAATVANTALKVTYKATDAALVDVKLDGAIVGQLGPSQNAFKTASLCVPEWAKGSVVDLSFTLPNLVGGALVRSFVVDDLSWATDATCPATPRLLDAGFERADVGQSWRMKKDDLVFSYAKRTALSPRSGAASLEIAIQKNCAGASATTSITIPPAAGASGPALKFWYKLPPAANATFSSSPGGALATSAAYTQKTVCLDPKRSGLPEIVVFSGTSLGACANPSFSNQTAFFDDVEVTTDASCPAQ